MPSDKEIVKSPVFERDTRQVFDSHHREQEESDQIFERLTTLIDQDYFGVPQDFFEDKLVLDAGCGSNCNCSYALLKCGAKHVTSMDMGEEWQDCARKRLAPFSGRFTLISGNALDLPFEDEKFHFVHCAGVLHHTKNPNKGFRELCRVTAKGGQTFITIMGTGNGLLYEWINLLRSKYKNEQEFRSIIDELTYDDIRSGLDWIFGEMKKFDRVQDHEKEILHSLFDTDFVLTIKDRLQAPTYHDFNFSEEQVRDWFATEGYSNIRRISRYPRGFDNLRRLLSPMYYHYNHPLARLWFGEGYLQMIGTKSQ